MPYRRRIVSVSELFHTYQVLHRPDCLTSTVGRPIHTQQCERPSIEELTRVQTLYIEELTRSVRILFSMTVITLLTQGSQDLEYVQGQIRKDADQGAEHH